MARDSGRSTFLRRSEAERAALDSFDASLNRGSRPARRQAKPAAFDTELPEVGPRLRQVIEASAVPVAPVAPVPPVARPPVEPLEPSESILSRFAIPGCAAFGLAATLATGAVVYGIASFSDPSSGERNGWYEPSPEPTEPTEPAGSEPSPDLAPELAPSAEPAPDVVAEVIELTDANFDSFIENAKGPVLVDFYATWCVPCKVLSPKLDIAAATTYYAGKITFVRVDVDKCKKTAAKYNIEFMPTLVAIEGGKETSRVEGPSDSDLQTFLDSLIK